MKPTVESRGRRRQEEMRFAHAGPFAPLLDPIRVTKPARDRAGHIATPEPRYTASPENYTIAARVGTRIATLLELAFGRERASAPGGSSRTRRRRKPQVKA